MGINPQFLAIHICALLNSGGGDIFAGVRPDRVITGVRVNRTERDWTRQMMDIICLQHMDPSVNASELNIEFIKVGGASRDDLRVLKISVAHVLTSRMFRVKEVSWAGFQDGIHIRDIVEPFIKYVG